MYHIYFSPNKKRSCLEEGFFFLQRFTSTVAGDVLNNAACKKKKNVFIDQYMNMGTIRGPLLAFG